MRLLGKEKNLLDLEHSVSLTKAGTFLALAFTSWFALFFGMKEFSFSSSFSATMATFVALIFFMYAFRYFKTCDDIHQQIRLL